MNIYDVLKIMSCENKAIIITKLLDCSNCKNETVSDIREKTGLKQANLSKHLMELKNKNIIIGNKSGREVMYKINLNFQEKWRSLLENIIQSDQNLKKYYCGCISKKH